IYEVLNLSDMVTNSFRRPVIFRAVLLSIAVAAMFISGCSGMNMYKITYNPDRQVYEYPLPGMGPVTLRTNSGELVTEDNFEQFIVELSDMSFMYPFDDRIELAGSPKGSDLKVASLYSESVHQIQEEQFKKAAETMDSLEEYYPEAVFYTDIAFLKGYANEKVGMKAEAKSNYENYLAFSSGKFSDRFRNYRYADEKDIHWLQQREYATRYLADLSPQTDAGFLQAIKPQYYYSSLQPGYTLNPEDQYERPRGIFSVSLGSDLSSDFSGGFQYYRNLIGGVDINPEFAISRNMWEIKMAIPVQVYRSDNNRLGIK